MRRSVGLETASDTGRASIGPRDEQGINDKRGMLHVEPRRLTANMWVHMLCTSGVALCCVWGIMVCVAGSTLMKRRHLEKLGYTLISVPFFEWNALADAEEEEAYLQQRIVQARIARA